LTTGGEKQPDLPISDPPAAAVEPEGTPVGDEQELREAAQTELQQLKEAARFVTSERAVQVLEAMFFAAEKPLDLRALEETTQFPRDVLQAALTELQATYAPGSGAWPWWIWEGGGSFAPSRRSAPTSGACCR